jgi:hypothetical protein
MLCHVWRPQGAVEGLMKKHGFILVATLIAVASAVALSAGCAAKQQAQSPGAELAEDGGGMPKWLVKGCEIYLREEGRGKLCGVGFASGKNNTLARDTATAKARAELSKILNVRISSTVNEGRSDKGGEQSQNVTESTRQAVEAGLQGSRVADTWTAEDGTLYVLITMTANAFRNAVENIAGMPGDEKKALLEKTDSIFR